MSAQSLVLLLALVALATGAVAVAAAEGVPERGSAPSASTGTSANSGSSEEDKGKALVATSPVTVLDVANFDAQVDVIAGRERMWLVEFYAPWCPHCKRLAPVYKKVGEELAASGAGGSVARVGKVDCVANGPLCDRFGVRAYPTIKLIDEGTAKVYDFQGRRTLEKIVAFARDGWTSVTPSQFPLDDAEGAPQLHKSMWGMIADNLFFTELRTIALVHPVAFLMCSAFVMILCITGTAWWYDVYASGHNKAM